MHPYPRPGGKDGRVLWVSQKCLPGKTERTENDRVLCDQEVDQSSKECLKNWARFIKKIFEIDPLTCPHDKPPPMVENASPPLYPNFPLSPLKSLSLKAQIFCATSP
jgi:hypothetical protein